MTEQSDQNGNSKSLEQLRQEIDSIDTAIHELINKRASCAQSVADVKTREHLAAAAFESESGESSAKQLVFYRPEREAQVLRRVKEANKGPLSDDAVALIYREIMSACLALEKPMEVAYLGPEGTFTQAAALKHFGHAVMTNSQATIDAVFNQVEAGNCAYGVVPVENSTEGMVNHTLDSFVKSPLQICGEVELQIHHHLLSKVGSKRENIAGVCAHQQALAQCRTWLDSNLPNVPRTAVASNAEAAKLASTASGVAAIAGDMAADRYGLVKLAENIEDLSDNTTRFLIIGRDSVEPSGDDKTSIVVSTRDKPGALFRLLEPFNRRNLMLTRIDTRPSKTEKWAYVFFIEFAGHRKDEVVVEILKELEEHSLLLKVLGSYPKAVL